MRKIATLVLCLLICLVRTTFGACSDQILRISDAGRIESTSNFAELGEPLTVTCSSKCAWNWHTVLVNGDILQSSFVETRDFRISVKDEILNCESCSEPDEIDCNDDSQGPVQSVLNITLLTAGDYYIQCVAHLFQPDSDLWPSNRIISIPSRALQIKGIEKAVLSESTTSSLAALSSVTPHHASSSLINSHTMSSYTIVYSSSLISSQMLSASIHTELESSVTTTPSKSSLIRVTTTSVTSTLRTTEIEQSESSKDTMQVLRTSTQDSSALPIITMQANAGQDQGTEPNCEPSTLQNKAIFVVLGILIVLCLLLIAVIVVLICVNRRNVALYNQLREDSLEKPNEQKLT